jgi:hypothetical protein
MTEMQSSLLMWLAVLCLAVVFAVCVIGVRSRIFKDSLSQRTGLGLVSFGTLAEASHILHSDIADPYRVVLYVGLAVYSSATVLQWYRLWLRHGRPSHAFRRSTDLMPDDALAGAEPEAGQADMRRAA